MNTLNTVLESYNKSNSSSFSVRGTFSNIPNHSKNPGFDKLLDVITDFPGLMIVCASDMRPLSCYYSSSNIGKTFNRYFSRGNNGVWNIKGRWDINPNNIILISGSSIDISLLPKLKSFLINRLDFYYGEQGQKRNNSQCN